MKRCVVEHTMTGFGVIPAGSLWDDDSPFLTDETAGYFTDADTPTEPAPTPPPVRKARISKLDAKDET